MFDFINKKRISRNRVRDGVDNWKYSLIDMLTNKVIPAEEPYFYDAVFSFLQRDRSDLTHPIRLTLFFPNYPLALDLVGADGRSNYLESRRYISKPDWEDLHADLAVKADKLSLHRCPYLVIRDIDPTDAYSLRDRIKALTGRRLRS